MLTKALSLLLVIFLGLALGIETARYVHAHVTGVDVSGAVNIHLALGFGLLATSGALLLSLSREWLSRQWTRFTVWFELTLDGLFDFDELDVVLRGDDAKHASPEESGCASSAKGFANRSREICRRRSENGACAQDALDDAAKTTCTGCGDRGHWWFDCPAARPPPSREGRQPNGSYVVEVRPGETHEGPV